MGKMEKSLTAEVKRRIEMNKSIQAWCEQQIVAMKVQVRGSKGSQRAKRAD